MSRPLCGRRRGPGGQDYPCTYPRMKGKQQCEWHWLAKQPAHTQASYAAARCETQLGHDAAEFQARVPSSRWPDGERWCAGCQSMVPLFYCSGSRCKSCASEASHASRVQATYGISKAEYEELFRQQGGRCFICQRQSKTLRLAVDHDHETGKVRGLLCANNENGCNRGVVANLEAAHDGGLKAARRAVLYLAMPPYDRTPGEDYSWASFIRSESQRLAVEAAQERPSGPVAHKWSV